MSLTITITPTNTITDLDGVPCRLWEGRTADGILCNVFIHRIAVAEDRDTAAFDRVLREQLPPGRRVPLSMIL